MYCTTGAAGGKTLGAFKVPNIKRAMQVIANRKTPRRDMKVKLRGNKGRITPNRRATARR